MAGSGEKKGNPAGAPPGPKELAGRPVEARYLRELISEAYTNFVRDFESLFDAGPDRGSIEIISHEIQAGKGRAVVVDHREAGRVAQVVLRKGARPDADVRKYRPFSKLHQRPNFAVNQGNKLVGGLSDGVRIGCAAHKACQ